MTKLSMQEKRKILKEMNIPIEVIQGEEYYFEVIPYPIQRTKAIVYDIRAVHLKTEKVTLFDYPIENLFIKSKEEVMKEMREGLKVKIIEGLNEKNN